MLQPLLRRLARDERGATAVEYGLIAALIVVAVVAGVTSVAEENTKMYNKIEEAVIGVS
ncbi:Flp family type IVb pilin [Hyphomonas sp.]|uniref:Flp family type IVb pilin n=1 Tax=Hyphomonas sp. TaxID=87 RepID=UPI00391D4A71